MKTADKYKLCVSPLTGEAYLSALDKDGNMTDNRRKIEKGEILKFIHDFSLSEFERQKNDHYFITVGGEAVMKIENCKNKDSDF